MFSTCDSFVEENVKAKTPRMSIKSQSVDVYMEDEVTIRTCLLFIVQFFIFLLIKNVSNKKAGLNKKINLIKNVFSVFLPKKTKNKNNSDESLNEVDAKHKQSTIPSRNSIKITAVEHKNSAIKIENDRANKTQNRPKNNSENQAQPTAIIEPENQAKAATKTETRTIKMDKIIQDELNINPRQSSIIAARKLAEINEDLSNLGAEKKDFPKKRTNTKKKIEPLSPNLVKKIENKQFKKYVDDENTEIKNKQDASIPSI